MGSAQVRRFGLLELPITVTFSSMLTTYFTSFDTCVEEPNFLGQSVFLSTINDCLIPGLCPLERD